MNYTVFHLMTIFNECNQQSELNREIIVEIEGKRLNIKGWYKTTDNKIRLLTEEDNKEEYEDEALS
jgi:hypothetical protein